MKSKPNSLNTRSADNVALASGVMQLMDANDTLERALVAAAKSVSTIWRIQTREIGESIYVYLDELNGRLEAYANPKDIAVEGAKGKLRRVIVRGEEYVSKLAAPLRAIRGLDPLRATLDEWTETYLDMASLTGSALEPTPSEPEDQSVSLAA